MYNLSESCELTVHEDLSVFMKNRKSTMAFPDSRWKNFSKYFNEIQDAVEKLKKKEHVKLFVHLGGAIYISVTTGFKCVDIRRFRQANNDQLLPTLDGLSLRLCEWNTLFSSVSKKMELDYPAMNDVVLCADGMGHNNQMGFIRCGECNPHSFMDNYFY